MAGLSMAGGVCKIMLPDGYYAGTSPDGKTVSGKGNRFWDTGKRYEGELLDGKRHGYGKNFMPNGNRYEGNWKDDKCHGEGIDYYVIFYSPRPPPHSFAPLTPKETLCSHPCHQRNALFRIPLSYWCETGLAG